MGKLPISSARERSFSFSFVIPCFNARKTIGTTLDSIRAQTVQPLEVIVIDDGSSDGTLPFVQREYPEVRIVSQENAGPAAARNHGIRLARGDWIAFIDADDRANPDRLAQQRATIHATDADLVCGRLTGIRTPPVNPINFDVLWHFNSIAMSSVCVNRSVVLQAGGFSTDSRLIGVEDYHLWLRLLAAGKKIAAVEGFVGEYLPGDNSLTQQLDAFFAAEQYNANWMLENGVVTTEQYKTKLLNLYEQYASEAFHAWNIPLAEHCYRQLLRSRFSFGALMRLAYIYSPFRMIIWNKKE